MRIHSLRSAAAALVLTGALQFGAVQAATTVTISDMHLCCRGCTMAVEKSLVKMEGIKCVTNQDDGTTVLDAVDAKIAQKALDAIAKAGFTGTLDTKELKFPEIKAPKGKVTRLEIYEVHNCCGACTNAIKDALAEVDGVTSDTCKSKKTEFVIEGNFSAEEAVAAMLKAGFYCSLEKPKAKAAPER